MEEKNIERNRHRYRKKYYLLSVLLDFNKELETK